VILIFDIDGTLTTSGDTPNEPVIARLREEAEKGERIFIVSGRLAARMEETKSWLSENEIPYEAIYLQDFSEDSSLPVIEAFKAFKYSKLLEEFGDQIGYLVDDDAEARDAAEGMGIDAYGPEAFVRLSARAIDPDGYEVTAEMRAEAEQGLEWRREFGRGGTEIGIARARDISNGRRLPYETVVRMSSYFARHEVDKEAQGFRPGEDGYPSNGRIAWALWSGDSGMAWASRIIREASEEDAQRNEGDEMAIEFTTKTGTLELEDREDGLLARIRLNPNVSFHRDLAEIVRTMGKSLGLSFGFYSTNANKVNEEGVRELRDVKLVEVSALTGLSPYYPSTISTVSVRSLASEAGLEIEPLRAAVNALLSGDVSDVEETIVEESAPRSVPRSTREKEIELAKRALK